MSLAKNAPPPTRSTPNAKPPASPVSKPPTPAAPGAATTPKGVAEPIVNPLAATPPAPAMPKVKRGPGRPRKSDVAASPQGSPSPSAGGAAAPQSATTTPETPKRELPAEPSARASALAPFTSTADMILGFGDVLAARLPPNMPLSATEKESIRGPLLEVIWKYDGNVPCELALVAAVGIVAFGRWMQVKTAAAEKATAPRPPPPLSPPTPAVVEEGAAA